MKSKSFLPCRFKQSGSALAVCLIILLVMTLVGVQGMRTTALEERMSGNYLDRKVAFEAAEAAMLAGERWLSEQTELPVADASGTYDVWTLGIDPFDDTWWTTNAKTVASGMSALSGKPLSAQPKYFIEYRQRVRGVSNFKSVEGGSSKVQPYTHFFTITGRGQGGQSNSVVLLQQSFARKF